MEIKPASQFRDCRDIPSKEVSKDPRDPHFTSNGVVLDLRECEFVWPAAAMWCAVYALLAQSKGIATEVLVPEHQGVAVYLASIGLFTVLKQAGVEVDDRQVRGHLGPQTILPFARFTSITQVETLTNQAFEAMQRAGLASANLTPLISETFGELAMNAVQHAESPVGAFGLVQFFQFRQGGRFVCCVGDGGVGVRRSLERNPANRDKVRYDWVALEYATRERITGTLDQHRGIGLFGVAEDMRRPGRSLLLHSGIGSVRIDEESEYQSRRTKLFPGTLAFASIPAGAIAT